MRTRTMRFCLMALAVFALHTAFVFADDQSQGKCTILNTTDHPIVIGLYRPSDSGIEERLVKVAPKTQIDDIPIPLVTDSQFVIAYKASMDEGVISRSDPILVGGHRILKYVKKSETSTLPDVIIRYRRGSSIQPSRPDPFNSSLYLPESASDAKRVLQDASQTRQLVAAPLAKQVYSPQAEQ